MSLIFLGATGRTGIQVVKQALAAGHAVTTVARHPAAIDIEHERLTVKQGDVLKPDTFAQAVHGKAAVVSALGVTSTEPTTVYSAGVAK